MKILKESGYFTNRKGETPAIFYTKYLPEDMEVKASLLIVHGMQEHSGRYEPIARYFAAHGFVVLTYDQLGHGRSVNQEDDLGFFQQKKPQQRLITDAIDLSLRLKEGYVNIPLFVLGHSMGSFVTRCLLQRIGDVFSGAVVVGTGGRLIGINMLNTYFGITNWFNPRKKVAFNRLFNAMNNWNFKKDNDSLAWISTNKRNRKAFKEDKLCGFPFSNNAFFTLFRIYKRATQKGWRKHIPKSLPFLFVSGGDDVIGNFGKGVQQSADDLKNHGCQQVEVKLYPEMRHEILNEEIKEQVYEDILRWLKSQW